MSRARVLTVRGVVASFLVVRWATIPRPVVFVCVASLGFFVFSNSVQGQDLFEIWSPLGDDLLWTNDDNWVDDQGNLSGAPSLSFESGGQINGGTVIIDSDVDAAGVIQNGGAIEIQSGSLTSDASENQTGVTRFNGEVILSAGTKLTGPDVTLGGVTRFLGSTAAIETKGDLSMRGELHLAIDGDGTSSIEVGGEANLRGPVFPNFSGVSPAFGDSFQFLSGATAVNISSGAAVVLPETVVLGRGLEARVEADGGNASVVIGNLPVLQVDRVIRLF